MGAFGTAASQASFYRLARLETRKDTLRSYFSVRNLADTIMLAQPGKMRRLKKTLEAKEYGKFIEAISADRNYSLSVAKLLARSEALKTETLWDLIGRIGESHETAIESAWIIVAISMLREAAPREEVAKRLANPELGRAFAVLLSESKVLNLREEIASIFFDVAQNNNDSMKSRIIVPAQAIDALKNAAIGSKADNTVWFASRALEEMGILQPAEAVSA